MSETGSDAAGNTDPRDFQEPPNTDTRPPRIPAAESTKDSQGATEGEASPKRPVTVGLIILLTLIHLGVQGLSGDGKTDFLLGYSVIPGPVLAGEWWRLLSGCFLHANWAHLGANLFGFLIFGNLLEPMIGPRAMLLLLLLSGVLGNLLSCFLMPADSLSIGASGMVYGLTGAYICLMVLFQRKLDAATPATAPKKSAGQLRGAVILLIVFIALHSQEPQMNLWAHLGGLASGVLFAPLWLRRLSASSVAAQP